VWMAARAGCSEARKSPGVYKERCYIIMTDRDLTIT